MDKLSKYYFIYQKLYTHCGKWCRLTRMVSCSVNASCSWRDVNHQLSLVISALYFHLLKRLILIRSSSALILSSAALIFSLSSRFLKLQFQRFRKVPALRAAFHIISCPVSFLCDVCLQTMYRPQYWSDRPDFFTVGALQL